MTMRPALGGLAAAATAASVILGVSLVGHSAGPTLPRGTTVVPRSEAPNQKDHAQTTPSPGSASATTTPFYLKTLAAKSAAAVRTPTPIVASPPVPPPASPPPFTPPGNPASCPGLGLFVAGENPASITTLASQLGVTAGIMTVYADQPTYTQFTPPNTAMRLLLGVGEVTPAEATTIGNTLVATGHANTMIRIMWEMNGNWFPWGTQSLSAAQYISIYQGAEQAFAAVPGNDFQYVWNVNAGTAEPGRTEFDTYPGSAYVSNIGIDYYDYGTSSESWVPPVIAFAAAEGKALSFDEWGVNGANDPAYIDYISSIVHDSADDMTVEAYFSAGNSTLTDYPAAETEYTKDFAGSC